MHRILFTAIFFTLASCAPVPVGGEGRTESGEKIIAEAQLKYDGNNTIILRSARGWSCTGSYSKVAAGNSTTRQFPLSCSNGAVGNAVMSVNSIQQRATIAFTLSNGVAGDVAFGFVS